MSGDKFDYMPETGEKLIQKAILSALMDIEKQLHLINEIDSEAETESLETYEERIHFYKNRRYTYIPMPSDDAYYNTEEGWVRELAPEQIVSEETHLMDVLRKLQKYPFLLVDYMMDRSEYMPKNKVLEAGVPEDELRIAEDIELSSHPNEETVILDFKQVDEYFPEIANEKVEEYEGPIDMGDYKKQLYRYGMVTLVDINRRPVKDMLYKVISELSYNLSKKIEDKYSDQERILKHMRPVTVGRWKKDRLEGLDLHISEHMNLLEMMQVIQSSNKEFVQDCGFTSKDEVNELNKINKIRNRVMHANRSLIYDREDIQKVLTTVDQAQAIVRNME